MKPISLLEDEDFEQFCVDALGDAAEGRDLYGRARAAAEPTPKVILHQATRLVSLADWMDSAAPSRPALKILFFVVLAEAVAKMTLGYMGERESKKHVDHFFENLCLSADRGALARAFRRKDTTPPTPLSLSEAIDVLYDVRNSVAHRGEYFGFHLFEPERNVITVTPYKDGSLEVFLSASQLRAIVIRGAVAAAERLLAQP